MNINSNFSEQRTNTLLEQIDLEGLNIEERNSITNLLREFSDIFYLKEDKLSHTNVITHKIDLIENAKPLNTKPYRIPMSQREQIDKEIQNLVNQGIISPTNSAWNAPLLIVPKKSDTDI